MSISQTVSQSIQRGTDAVAVSAVASPFWLPFLQSASETAALLLPIAGLAWLVTQMLGYLFWRKRK